MEGAAHERIQLVTSAGPARAIEKVRLQKTDRMLVRFMSKSRIDECLSRARTQIVHGEQEGRQKPANPDFILEKQKAMKKVIERLRNDKNQQGDDQVPKSHQGISEYGEIVHAAELFRDRWKTVCSENNEAVEYEEEGQAPSQPRVYSFENVLRQGIKAEKDAVIKAP